MRRGVAITAAALLGGCAAAPSGGPPTEGTAANAAPVGRWQVIPLGESTAILVDSATGETWTRSGNGSTTWLKLNR